MTGFDLAARFSTLQNGVVLPRTGYPVNGSRTKQNGIRLNTKRTFKMPVSWTHDVDAALAEAKQQHKPVLLDFSAAPM